MTFLARVQSHLKATSHRNIEEGASDISLRTLLLLTLALFIVSLACIVLMCSPNSTLWPSNAVLLVFLLRSRRDARNYGLILLGGGAAMALANLAGGYGSALSTVLTIGNIIEVATARI